MIGKLIKNRDSVRLVEQKIALPGLYHFQIDNNSIKSRIHLRIDDDGSGVLIINASRIIHLNQTATFMAHLILLDTPLSKAVTLLRGKYKLNRKIALNDYAQVRDTLYELIQPDGACPIHELNLDVAAPFSRKPSAPYRMDLAITYRCNNDCSHCYNARERTHPELSTTEWKLIIDRLWDYGIPHIVFTGGEPTLRNDLAELISHAETKGQITGLNTNGRRLADESYLARLVDAGLDHVQITIESHDHGIHDHMVNKSGAWRQTVMGIENVLNSPLFVMTNTTMLQDNSPYLADTLSYLANLGVPTIGLNALIYAGRGFDVGSGLDESELSPLLEVAREYTERHNQKLIWYTPTQYCHFDPMQLDLGIKGCTAALYNMCVESDGNVIPCQSYYAPLGNILRDDWDMIWNHDLSISLRERRNIPTICEGCALIIECGGGCPLTYDRTHIN